MSCTYDCAGLLALSSLCACVILLKQKSSQDKCSKGKNNNFFFFDSVKQMCGMHLEKLSNVS